MTWKPHVTVAAVLERDRRFLLVEENTDNRLVLNQPAGHLEDGESLLDAVRRETLEETAWHFEPLALLGVYRWTDPARRITYLRFAFTGRLLEFDPTRTLDQGIVRTLWLSPDEIRRESPRHRSPQVQTCIEDYLSGRTFPLDCLRDVAEHLEETRRCLP